MHTQIANLILTPAPRGMIACRFLGGREPIAICAAPAVRTNAAKWAALATELEQGGGDFAVGSTGHHLARTIRAEIATAEINALASVTA